MKSKRRSRAKVGMYAIVLVAVMAAAMLGACGTGGCMDNRSSIPLAGFYDKETKKQIQIRDLDIGGVDAPKDSLLLESGESATDVYLPFRQTESSARFFISYRLKDEEEPIATDYVEFHYKSIPYFASEECGAMLRYRITSVEYTRNLLDSIAVTAPDSTINNFDRESLQLYFRTATAEEEPEPEV